MFVNPARLMDNTEEISVVVGLHSNPVSFTQWTAVAATATGRHESQTSNYSLSSTEGAQLSHSTTDLQRACDRLLAGMVRGAAIGFTLRGGLHIVGSLLTAISKRRKRVVTTAAAVEDTLRYTAFLASLAGVYIGVDEGVAALLGKDRTARWRGLVAGCCAGPTLLLTGARNRHYSLATYILLRGITLLIRVGNKERTKRRHPVLHAALAPTRTQHGDTLLMCAACSQIIYAFIMMPHTLPQSYVRWIRKQAAKELYVWQGVRELAEHTASGRPLGPLTSLIGTPHAKQVSPTPCHFFHPHQSCWQHPLQLLVPAYGRALSVYIPVYLLPAVLVHRQQLIKQPLPILQKVAQGIARSSLFLSAFISLAFGGACLGHNLAACSTGAVIAASTWLGGLATLLEKKSRRMELALYVLSRSLESFSRCCVDWGWLSPRWLPPRLDVLLFAAGVGAILHCYSDSNGVHRDVFRSKYLGVFDFVFGNTGFTEGSIKHVPSNQDLFKHVSAAVGARVRARSLSFNSLPSISHIRTRSPSLADLHSVLESPAAGAAGSAVHADTAAGSIEQQGSTRQNEHPASALDAATAVHEQVAAHATSVATSSRSNQIHRGATAASSNALHPETPQLSPSSDTPAVPAVSAEVSAVMVSPDPGADSGRDSTGSRGSSFSEVEAAGSSDAGQEMLSMSM